MIPNFSSRLRGHPLSLPLVILTLALLVFLVDLALKSSTPDHRREGISARLRGILDSGNTQTVQAARRFEERMEQNAMDPQWESRFQQAAEHVARDLSRPKEMLQLVGLMVRDRLQGGERTRLHVRERVDRTVEPLIEEYAEQLSAPVRSLNRELAAIRGDTSTRLGSLLEPEGVSGKNWEASVQRMGITALFGGTVLSLDAGWMVRSRFPQRIALRLGSVCSAVLGRSAARAGASAVAPALDGPLPVGDVLAGIGLAWTALELHGARSRFQAELRHNLLAEMGSIRADLHEQAREQALELVLRHRHAQGELGELALREIAPRPKESP